jgi:hypothetical protein
MALVAISQKPDTYDMQKPDNLQADGVRYDIDHKEELD